MKETFSTLLMGSLTPVAQATQCIRISVDLRVALISIVQTLSRYREILPFLLNASDFRYAHEVTEHFSPYRNGPAVVMFDEISDRPGGFDYL